MVDGHQLMVDGRPASRFDALLHWAGLALIRTAFQSAARCM